MDWKDYGVKSIVKKCTQGDSLGNGSILLLHVGARHTAEALDQVITGLKEQGYDLVPVSQLIFTKDYAIDSEGRQFEK